MRLLQILCMYNTYVRIQHIVTSVKLFTSFVTYSCYVFCFVLFNSNPLCYCGYAKYQHLEKYRRQTRDRWDDNNTEVEPTDAFGEMLFVGYSQRLAKVFYRILKFLVI